MTSHKLKLKKLNGVFAVVKLPPDDSIPEWALRSPFFSITKTPEELSIVCEQQFVPDGTAGEKDWKGFKVQGPLAFGLVGILAKLTTASASEGISIFAISTYDTDYLLVKAHDYEKASSVLLKAGHEVS